MKVSELVAGSIYISEPRTIVNDQVHIILGVPGHPVLEIKERMVWRSYRQNPDNESRVYMYLGWTMDMWSINNIYKHHWFLVDGEKIVVNNYSLRLLKEVSHETAI